MSSSKEKRCLRQSVGLSSGSSLASDHGEIQIVVNEMDYSHRLDDKVQKAFLDNIHQFQK